MSDTGPQANALEKLRHLAQYSPGLWIKLDKIVGEALVRRGLAEGRKPEKGSGREYRLKPGSETVTPETPAADQPGKEPPRGLFD